MADEAALLERSGSAFRSGDTPAGLSLLNDAVEAGSSQALYQQALLFLVGEVVPRDLSLARTKLRDAASRGHADATTLEVALMANGTGARADWGQARDRLTRLGSQLPHVRDQLSALDELTLDDSGRPAHPIEATSVSTALSLTRYPGFLSRRECEHLARTAADLLEPAVVVDPASGRQVAHPVRTSDTATIGPAREDLLIRAVNLRIAAATNTAVEQGEPLSVLRYRPGQQYRLHTDAWTGAENQRVRTVLIYLNDAFSGGETAFPALGLVITPKAGDAIAFDSLRSDGTIDPLSKHAGLPVTSGAKWLATRWIRERPFDPWAQSDIR